MNIEEKKLENLSVLSIIGRLDTTNYQELDGKLQKVMNDGITKIVINCADMDYVSSSGLRVFLMYLKKISAEKGSFVICCLQDSIKEIFKISGFSSIFQIFDNEAKAVADIS